MVLLNLADETTRYTEAGDFNALQQKATHLDHFALQFRKPDLPYTLLLMSFLRRPIK